MGVPADGGACPNAAAATQPELTVSRLIDAPPALVFKCGLNKRMPRGGGGRRGSPPCRAAWTGGRAASSASRCGRQTAGSTPSAACTTVVPPQLLVFTYAWEDVHGNSAMKCALP